MKITKTLTLSLFYLFFLITKPLSLEISPSIQKRLLSLSAFGTTCYFIHNITPIFVKVKDNFTHLEEDAVSYLCYQAKETQSANEAYVFAHGFRGSGFSSHIIDIAQSNPTGKCYSLHFEDARTRKVFRTSMGQDADIADLIKLLNILAKKYDTLHIIGHSRGGATVVNSIAVLLQHNHPLLASINIDETTRKDIITKINKGSILLKTPLLDMSFVCKKHFSKLLGPIVHYTCSFLTFFRYKPWGHQAIESIELWTEFNPKTLICFAKKDSVVGNALDDIFIEKIKKIIKNVSIHYYDGDHTDRPEEYKKTIKDFYTR